jgi:hypothetical protein
MELPFFAIAIAILARTAIMAWRRAQTSTPAAATRNLGLCFGPVPRRHRLSHTGNLGRM